MFQNYQQGQITDSTREENDLCYLCWILSIFNWGTSSQVRDPQRNLRCNSDVLAIRTSKRTQSRLKLRCLLWKVLVFFNWWHQLFNACHWFSIKYGYFIQFPKVDAKPVGSLLLFNKYDRRIELRIGWSVRWLPCTQANVPHVKPLTWNSREAFHMNVHVNFTWGTFGCVSWHWVCLVPNRVPRPDITRMFI